VCQHLVLIIVMIIMLVLLLLPSMPSRPRGSRRRKPTWLPAPSARSRAPAGCPCYCAGRRNGFRLKSGGALRQSHGYGESTSHLLLGDEKDFQLDVI
jgi:hypothetical protein